MAEFKVSVIVPIYNTGEYLEETLMSLINQTIFEDIEVIMIDDGSCDESRYLVEKFALDYDNFYSYHKENEGQGIARNYGLKLAKGEYIHFMDSDDYIVPDAYEKLYNLAISNNYDFVTGNVLRFYSYGCLDDLLFKNSFKNFNENKEFHSINDCPSLVWDSSVSNKLYKKEFLEKQGISFPDEKIFYEDVLFSYESYIKSNSFGYLDYYFYYWRRRDDSTTSISKVESYKNFNDRLDILLKIKRNLKDINLTQDTLNALYEKWLIQDLKIFLKRINKIPSQYHKMLLNKVSDIVTDIPEEIKDNLNSYHKILYKLIEDNDIHSLLYFAPLEYDLKKSKLRLNLEYKYTSLADFYKDSLDEELNAKITEKEHDDDNLILTFDYEINYLYDKNYNNITAILIDENQNEEILEIKGDQIFIPFDLLVSKKSVKIKIKYDDGHLISKETFLKNNGRKSIIYKDHYDLEMAMGVNRVLSVNINKLKDNNIQINNIAFDNSNFLLEGKSENKIEDVIIENVIDFNKIVYPVEYIDESEKNFSLNIPYSDIINAPVKKWEIKTESIISLSDSFIFFRDFDQIYFSNRRNKILIENKIYNRLERLKELTDEVNELKKDYRRYSSENKRLIKGLKSQNAKLINKNKKLRKNNDNLNNLVEEYKSRKVIIYADKIKGIKK